MTSKRIFIELIDTSIEKKEQRRNTNVLKKQEEERKKLRSMK